ncbi:hypothetical protein K437DRAFT_242549 [Tilletiaria anomala UBC 951]|uniref:[histone H3]-trimethyl-L-lysine(4) demethylase n=1 Tax=Tilletiaria anomala (strain ATCC 24038 / CBS 436.72 / UBC 951) TaxID=1037660 RepID=A0A066WR55_TILAU|nr:uncharacterized protein K437DRAFT_242549 [Tilletiaria anomala UBC 951]KDN53130.1 hypothetical protein K437DRAFT_242549 [Tilletiaria anomala UBC 951]
MAALSPSAGGHKTNPPTPPVGSRSGSGSDVIHLCDSDDNESVAPLPVKKRSSSASSGGKSRSPDVNKFSSLVKTEAEENDLDGIPSDDFAHASASSSVQRRAYSAVSSRSPAELGRDISSFAGPASSSSVHPHGENASARSSLYSNAIANPSPLKRMTNMSRSTSRSDDGDRMDRDERDEGTVSAADPRTREQQYRDGSIMSTSSAAGSAAGYIADPRLALRAAKTQPGSQGSGSSAGYSAGSGRGSIGAAASSQSSSSDELSFEKHIPSAVMSARQRCDAEPVLVSSREYGPAMDLVDTTPAIPLPEGEVKKEKKGKDLSSRAQDTMATTQRAGMIIKTEVQERQQQAQRAAEYPSPKKHPLRKVAQIGVAERLPFDDAVTTDSSELEPRVPTVHSTPRFPPPRTRPRVFGLEEAPTFYPTKEEFLDPMKYIDYVSSPQGGNGKEYGIIKIVPPEGWKLDFVLDEEKFRFKTRVQRLNSLSADARASLNYQEQLQMFHAQQGQKRIAMPIIAGKALDFYSLKLVVSTLGGFDKVTKNRRWTEVAREIGYDETRAAHISTQVKQAYKRIILPFEVFLVEAKEMAKRDDKLAKAAEGVKSGASASRAATPSTTVDDSDNDPFGTAAAMTAADKRRAPRSKKSGDVRGKGKKNGEVNHVITTEPGYEEQVCEICMSGEDGVSMLLCDECNRGYHMYCLNPPIATVPKSEWYCPPCLVGTGNDYGFEEGDTHSLHSFWKRSEAFRKDWFEKRPERVFNGHPGSPTYEGPDGDIVMAKPSGDEVPPNGVVRQVAGTKVWLSEDDVEREFWRLVHSPDELVDIEYGADIHSTTHGSASPSMETHPLNRYSKDVWNLNNLPILPSSLLRYIKSDISGMTVPWIYVGMIFSAFCWHNEDHYTYSINYQHFGHTKTWYGVPGADAEKLEEAMRKAAPDLFEANPDLLFQLVTMMGPAKLKKEGVRVFACDQRPNEFVITYPKAYHAGFNHGFNLNEAVNFALPDWMDYGLQCVQRYQKFCKSPVFSQDELIITVAQHNHALTTALWLQHPMAEMIERELNRRLRMRREAPGIREKLSEFDKPEEHYQCKHCSMFCYLSQVTLESYESGVACLDHASSVFSGQPQSRWVLRLRVGDDQLKAMQIKLMERANVPGNWRRRLHNVLNNNPRPPLKTLRALLAEGERITTPLPEIEQLREFVERANTWVDQASVFITRKGRVASSTPRKLQSRTSTGSERRSPSTRMDLSSDVPAAKETRTPEALMTLLSEADQLPFDAPEISAVRHVIEKMGEIQERVETVLRQVNAPSDVKKPSLVECEKVIAAASEINVDIAVVDDLTKYVNRRKWLDEMDEIHNNFINLSEVHELLSEAEKSDVPSGHHYVVDLRRRERLGKAWANKAQQVLDAKEAIQVSQLEELITAPNEVAIVPELHVQAERLYNKVKELNASAQQLIASGKDQDPRTMHKSELEARLAEAKQLSRTTVASRLFLPALKPIADGLQECDEWLQRLTDILNAAFHSNRPEPVSKSGATIKVFCAQIETTASPDDEQASQVASPPKQRYCVCRTKTPPVLDGQDGIRCNNCQTLYHQMCIKVGGKTKKLTPKWVCHICDPVKLRDLLPHRRAVRFEDVNELVDDSWFHAEKWSDKFTCPPPEYIALKSAVGRASRLGSYVRGFMASGRDPSRPEDRTALHHLLRKTLACPLNINLAGQSSVVDEIVRTLHSAEALQPPKLGEMGTEGEPKKRKRGKRAKFTFEEEAGLSPTSDSLYCICHQAESGNMIGCDRCQLWFHTNCMHLPEDLDLGEEKWMCPMCCSKTEKRYAFADVRVLEKGRSEADGSFVDLRLTLRSEDRPISRCQPWTKEKRILLHLANFQAAVKPEQSPAEPPVKKTRTEETGSYLNQAPVQQDSISSVDPAAGSSSTSSPIPSSSRATSAIPAASQVKVEERYSTAGFYAPSVSNLPSARKVLQSHDLGRSASPANVSAISMPPMSPIRGPQPDKASHAWTQQLPQGQPSQNIDSQKSTPPVPSKKSLSPNSRTAAERHRAGMANLYARGVTDEMIQKWYIGWNGKTLVYPRYTSTGELQQIELGPRIKLAPGDREGTIFITNVLKGLTSNPRSQSSFASSQPGIRECSARPAASASSAPHPPDPHDHVDVQPSHVTSGAQPSKDRADATAATASARPQVQATAPFAPTTGFSGSAQKQTTATATATATRSSQALEPTAAPRVGPEPSSSVTAFSALAGLASAPTAAEEASARAMARRMRPTATESELNDMVAAFLASG